MTPQHKEIIQLNREIGEALGHLTGLLCNYKEAIMSEDEKRLRNFIEKVNTRKSFLEDERKIN